MTAGYCYHNVISLSVRLSVAKCIVADHIPTSEYKIPFRKEHDFTTFNPLRLINFSLKYYFGIWSFVGQCVIGSDPLKIVDP